MSIDLGSLPEALKPYQDKIRASIKTCVSLNLKPVEQLVAWQSKIGGWPYLPLDMDYPRDSDGRPLNLLAQINFAEVPPIPDFPTQGILQFYIGSDDLYGLNFDDPQSQDTFRVLYFEQVVEDINQLQQDFSDLAFDDDEGYLPFTGQYAIDFQVEQQAISPGDFAFGAKVLDVEHLYDFDEQYQGEDFYEDCIEPYTKLFPETGHRLGGYPFFTQTDPREYNEKIQDYILLFQLDTDDRDGKDIMWGDAGVGNFFIHPDDLKKRDFSRVVYNWDCS